MSETAPDAPPAPQGVRLRRDDGSVVECDVVRDPGFDRLGVTYWRIVPRMEGEPALGTWQVEFDAIPPHTGVWVDVPLAGPGLSALGTPQDLPARES